MNYNLKYIILFIVLFVFIPLKAQEYQPIESAMDIRSMEEKYPDVFTKTKANHPDTAFEIGRKTTGFNLDFVGENGKLQFYLLYAQHLQKLNKNNSYTEYRPRFIALYQSINKVNQLIDTKIGYYEQMQSMLIAYAEYSIYEINIIDQSKIAAVDVDKQRKFFIKSMQQKVKTKNLQLNLNSSPNFNKNQILITEEIKKIEQLINDAYSLKVAQVFHYTYF